MQLKFYKYQGTGNDFVMIDNRDLLFPKNQELIAQFCHRRFGIGADGLILLEKAPHYDFRMLYYNANGLEGSMCGNGGRCAVAFAQSLGIFEQKTTFIAVDGEHEAFITEGLVHLKMKNVTNIEINSDYFFLDTGSPHYVEFVENLSHYQVFEKGKAIRYNDRFRENGTNVNFVEVLSPNCLQVRTYERGVEDETYSCGTGVTASVLAYSLQNAQSPILVETLGGQLQISYEKTANGFENIYLIGKAQKVFEGEISI
ncbi:MAG: diaminopimelate epimerase [Thermonemataceae bacterium]|nr:diaminopimelate epimerase [Thermonemataceae bacterium]